jgi:HAD superfamily hydrolase (TIGR01509 family)
MIKAIVYDLDGMVFKEPHYYTEEMEKKFGIPLKDSLFSKDPRYLACKRGEISLDKFLKPYFRKWQKYPKFKLTLEQAKKDWFDFAKINKKIVKIAKLLKEKGVVNLIMTNNSRERIKYLDKKYRLSDFFEIIGSYDLGVLKPNPAFYQVLKKKYGLKPNEVLYFDDKKETVKTLKKFGFKAVVYRNFSQFCQELKKLGVKI